MSPHKLRKTRKRRGSRTMGWGQVGQHRKHGQKGGRKSGCDKHLWSYILKYEPNYFGKRGFKTLQRGKVSIINVRQLDELIHTLKVKKQLNNKGGKAFIDLSKLGYDKLLATGQITKPVVIKVGSHSEKAAKKIEEAGGTILSELNKYTPKEVEMKKKRK